MTEGLVDEQPLQLPFSFAGGMNAWDYHDQLIRRSHSPSSGGWNQNSAMESPVSLNIEFFTEGWGQRLGSVEAEDLTGVLLSGDVLLDGVEWRDPVAATRILWVLSQQTVYLNQSGSWAQVTHNNTGALAYTHNTTPTLWTFMEVDGHLLTLVDGADNRIIVYRRSTALDDPLGNNTTATAVDVTSAAAQKVLSVAATTMFKVGDRINIDPDGSGGGQEYGWVASISAGVSVTLMDNLANEHTLAQADVVQVDNAYVEAYDTSVSHTVTGLWETAIYLGELVNDRLAFGVGNSLLEYTPNSRAPSSGIWDLAGADAGFYGARGAIVAIASFVPEGGDVNRQLLHVFTTAGPGILTGFQEYDEAMDANRQTGGVPLNHRCVVATKNWLMYLTDTKDIEAINGPTWINIGRRLKNREKTGPLDAISISESAKSAFGVYDGENERVIFQATTASGRVADFAAIVDLRLGEPQRGELVDSYDKHVRLLPWSIINPDSNPWFKGAFQGLGTLYGVHQNGKLYTIGGSTLPRRDLGVLAVSSRWDMPWFNGGGALQHHAFLHAALRFNRSGNWVVTLNVYADYGDQPTKTVEVSQTSTQAAVYGTARYDEDAYAPSGIVLKLKEIDRYQQSLKLSIENDVIDRYWLLVAGVLEYQQGAAEFE